MTSRKKYTSSPLKLSNIKPFKKYSSNTRRKLNSSGFTIIELITVVFIIGVLASLAIIGYVAYIEKAKKISAISDIKNIVKDIRIDQIDTPLPASPLDDIGNVFPHLDKYVDPWGNPYRYASPPVRTKPGSPLPNNWINREFDVYSLGEDRASTLDITQAESLDDIIRAGEDAYIGLASGDETDKRDSTKSYLSLFTS